MSALPAAYVGEQRVGRRVVEVDARDSRVRALEDDVFGFLHVQRAAAQVFEHVREHTGPIAMAHHEHVRRRRFLREVDDVRYADRCPCTSE